MHLFNRPGTTRLAHFGCLAMIATLIGCDLAGPKVYVEENRVIELSAMGIETLSAVTQNGQVKIEATASGDETILAEVTIRAGAGSEEEAYKALSAVRIVTPLTGDDEEVQEIRSEWIEKHPFWSATVSYKIVMPADLALRVETHNGPIEVHDIEGACQLDSHNGKIEVNGASEGLAAETHNGAIDVATDSASVKLVTYNGGIKADLATDGPLEGKLQTHNGSVKLSFEEGVSADVECQTRNGRVSINGKPMTNVWEKRGRNRNKHVKGTLGTGGTPLKVETHNGSISLDID